MNKKRFFNLIFDYNNFYTSWDNTQVNIKRAPYSKNN